jgi:hypothetical protein
VDKYSDEEDSDEDEDEDEDGGWDRYSEKDYPSDWETVIDENGIARPKDTFSLSGTIPLGTVPTVSPAGNDPESNTGRIITFPNWIQVRPPGILVV